MSKHPLTLFDEPEDHEWWKKVFSESEHTMLERTFQSILDAATTSSDPIEILITIKDGESFIETLAILIEQEDRSEAIDGIIQDMCMIYMEDDRIGGDHEINMFIERKAREQNGYDD